MEAKEYSEEIDFQKYWLVLRRRWLPALSIVIVAIILSCAYAVTRSPKYQANGKLLFQTSRATSLIGVDEDFGKLEALSVRKDPVETQAQLLKSTALLDQIVADANLRDDSGEALSSSSIKSNLKVEPVLGTDVIEVSYKTGNPQLAADVVNALMEVYVEYDIRTNRLEAEAARKFIDKRLPIAERTVDRAAEALRKFKRANGIYHIQEQSEAAALLESQLNQNISEASAELAAARTRLTELSQKLIVDDDLAVELNNLSQAPGIESALLTLQEAQLELAREQAKFTDDHPIIKDLMRQKASAEVLLKEQVEKILQRPMDVPPGSLQLGELQQTLIADWVEAKVNRQSLESRVQSLIDTRDRYLAWTGNLPNLQKRLQYLEGRFVTAQEAYETLLARQKEVQLVENQTVGNARVINWATVPKTSVRTKGELYVVAGAAAGLIIGIASAFLLDIIDRSLKTVKEAKALFGFPLLGSIPRYRLETSASNVDSTGVAEPLSPTALDPSPLISDAYQMLQANLKFVSSDKRMKTFVVTSSVTGEGKTSVAAQLALTISQSGRKVLLIEADMRFPSQHHVWQVLNGVGLSHVLVGEGSLDEALQPVAKNLTLMTAGVTPPNPLALLDSEQMENLLTNLSQRYDTIVIDTPSLAGAADAAIIGKMADGVLLVVRPRVADSARATVAKSLLQRSGAMVLGLVANAVDIKAAHEDYASHISPSRTEAKSSKKTKHFGLISARFLQNSRKSSE